MIDIFSYSYVFEDKILKYSDLLVLNQVLKHPMSVLSYVQGFQCIYSVFSVEWGGIS